MRKARGADACSRTVVSLVLFSSVWPFRHSRSWGWVVAVLVGGFLPWSLRCSNWKPEICYSGWPK